MQERTLENIALGDTQKARLKIEICLTLYDANADKELVELSGEGGEETGQSWTSIIKLY